MLTFLLGMAVNEKIHSDKALRELRATITAMSSIEGTPTGRLVRPTTPAPSPTPTPSPTPPKLPLTATPAAVSPKTPPIFLADWQAGVPDSGTTLNVKVAPGEVRVLVGMSSVNIRGISIPGGERGSIVVMLPASRSVTTYSLSGLVPKSYWLGTYKCTRRLEVETLVLMIREWVEACKAEPCSAQQVDVVIVGPSEETTHQATW